MTTSLSIGLEDDASPQSPKLTADSWDLFAAVFRFATSSTTSNLPERSILVRNHHRASLLVFRLMESAPVNIGEAVHQKCCLVLNIALSVPTSGSWEHCSSRRLGYVPLQSSCVLDSRLCPSISAIFHNPSLNYLTRCAQKTQASALSPLPLTSVCEC